MVHFKRLVTLKKNSEFKQVYNKGKSIANKTLVIYVLKNMENENKLGVSCSKKVGNSVVRSRVTRLIKESFRLNKSTVKGGFDVVVIARLGAKDATYAEINAGVLHLLKKHNMIL